MSAAGGAAHGPGALAGRGPPPLFDGSGGTSLNAPKLLRHVLDIPDQIGRIDVPHHPGDLEGQPTLHGRVIVLMFHGLGRERLAWEVVDDDRPTAAGCGQDLRERAIARLKEKRDFGAHLFVYLVVNAFVVGTWAFTGAGFFWPVFLLFGWGIGLVLHAREVYWRKPMSEDRIRQEMERMT